MPLSVFLINDKGILFDPQEVAVAGTSTKLEGDIEKNKEIGAIYGTWGPFFQVSFELIIHSHVKGKGKQGWSSVLAFDKKPSVDLNKNGELRIFFEKKKNNFISNVDLNKWYNISMEQKPKNEKVRKNQNG